MFAVLTWTKTKRGVLRQAGLNSLMPVSVLLVYVGFHAGTLVTV